MENIEQYPKGQDLLWLATFRKDPAIGLMDGFSVKLSGSCIEAAIEADKVAIKENVILQCLNRRF